MPLSSSSVDRRIPEALSTSRSKPAGVSDGNWIQTKPGKGRNTILRLYNPLESFFDKSWRGRRIRKDRRTIQMACQIPSPVGMRNPYATHILLRLPAQNSPTRPPEDPVPPLENLWAI